MPRRRKTPSQIKNAPAMTQLADGSFLVMAHKASENLSDTEKAAYIRDVKNASEGYGLVNHGDMASASYRDRNYENLQTGVDARPPFTRKDYEWFRPEEAIPNDYKKISLLCDRAYCSTGLIRNIVDLMGDFASQGIRITHPDKRIQRFYRRWFKKISGKERTERFCNNLIRLANVFIRRHTGILDKKETDKLLKVTGADVKPAKREVPSKYTFYHPAVIEQVGGALASFTDKKLYAIRLPSHLRKIILAPKDAAEKKIVDELPRDIVEAARTNTYYVLPEDKTFAYFYKKDDWQPLALPMIYSILDDVNHLNNLRLADDATLSGLTSKIRIIKLGDLDKEIAPTESLCLKMQDILASNTASGIIDIIWGPAVDIIETANDSRKLFTEADYAPALNAIYSGLGIPPTLTGTYGAAGTTNNFISLQTLIERLNYIRNVLTEFWNQELEFVRQAMGFNTAAQVEFDFMNLGNKEAVLALYVQLADRNIVSDEALQQIFGLNPEVEKQRLKRETKERGTGKMVDKLGPYVEFEKELKKIALTSGLATPSEVGLELLEKKAGEKSILQFQKEMKPPAVSNNTPKGRPGQGRPKNKKDSTKRKKKKFSPRSRAMAAMYVWAKKAYEEISNILNPVLLESFGKASFRAVSDAELKQAEDIKFGVLSNVQPYTAINEDIVLALIREPSKLDISKIFEDIQASLKTTLSIDEMRITQLYLYTALYGDTINDSDL